MNPRSGDLELEINSCFEQNSENEWQTRIQFAMPHHVL